MTGRDNHYRDGRERDAHYLSQMTLEQAETSYRHGHIDQIAFEAFMHAWSTGAPRFSSEFIAWTTEPTDPEVVALVAAIRAASNPNPAGHCRECDAPMFARYAGLREVLFVDRAGEWLCPVPVPCMFEANNEFVRVDRARAKAEGRKSTWPDGWDYRNTAMHTGCPCRTGIPHQLVPARWTGPVPPDHCGWPIQYRGAHWQCRRCPEQKPVE